MKLLFTTLITLSFYLASAQNNRSVFAKQLQELKSKSVIDTNDSTALIIINNFYEEVLQSDKGELQESTSLRLNKFVKSEESKNKYLIILFLIYQKHISETSLKGIKSNPDFQLETLNILEKEYKELYQVIPPIIYVYKVEALNNGNKLKEARSEILRGLSIYPESVPLKVYQYLAIKEESLKKDLIVNHSNHWLVQLNNIK